MTDKKLSGKEFEALCKAGVSIETIHTMHSNLQQCSLCEEELLKRMTAYNTTDAKSTATYPKLS